MQTNFTSLFLHMHANETNGWSGLVATIVVKQKLSSPSLLPQQITQTDKQSFRQSPVRQDRKDSLVHFPIKTVWRQQTKRAKALPSVAEHTYNHHISRRVLSRSPQTGKIKTSTLNRNINIDYDLHTHSRSVSVCHHHGGSAKLPTPPEYGSNVLARFLLEMLR